MTPTTAPPKGKCVVHVDPKLKDLVPAFLENRRKDVQRLLKEVGNEHFESIRLIGHSMKGAGGGYGFNHITDIGRDIESAARDGDGGRVRQLAEHLSTYLDRVEVVVEAATDKKGRTNPTILSVDDDPDTQNLLTRLLVGAGYDVVTADSGGGALALLKTVRPNLILLDVMMPGMDGYELCARLQKDATVSYIPVIFVTALGDEQNKARAFATGAVDYLVKPVQPDTLQTKIATHLKTQKQWKGLQGESAAAEDPHPRPDFARFKKHLISQMNLGADEQLALLQAPPLKLYSAFARAGIDSRSVARKIAEFMKLTYRAQVNPDYIHLGLLPTAFCRANGVVAVNAPPGERIFVLCNPFDWQLLDTLKRFRPYKILITEPESIAALFDGAPGGSAPRPFSEPEIDDLPAEPAPAWAPPPAAAAAEPPHPVAVPTGSGTDILGALAAEDLVATARPETREEEVRETNTGIVRLVNKIVIDAHKMRASDVHIEPYPDEDLVIRFRIDGVCQEYLLDGKRIPRKYARAVVSRIKIMSNLDIAEKRLPQDGKIKFRDFAPLDIELRVATLPTAQSQEDVVIRLLSANKPMALNRIGMSEHNLKAFEKILQAPYGLALCVGPTGSGKTTTLHSALRSINKADLKIWTAEDPVEISQRGLRQVQVLPKIGFTFERALRAFLRADPDVIMVGEMRDVETTQAGIEASLTGHLVLSTLHTNSAPETVTRLLDMGIDPFSFGDSLLGVLAQRLCRRLCPECLEKYTPSAGEWATLVSAYGGEADWQRHGLPGGPVELHRPRGCAACRSSGFQGRTGIHEQMTMNGDLRQFVYRKSTAAQLREAAVRGGMIPLMQDGIQKVLQGITTFNEVQMVCS